MWSGAALPALPPAAGTPAPPPPARPARRTRPQIPFFVGARVREAAGRKPLMQEKTAVIAVDALPRQDEEVLAGEGAVERLGAALDDVDALERRRVVDRDAAAVDVIKEIVAHEERMAHAARAPHRRRQRRASEQEKKDQPSHAKRR